jgi:excisionase family DNA binding protein
MKDKFYTPQEVAELLKISYMTVFRWIRAGKMKAYKLGKQYRISKEELDKFLEEGRV